MPVSSPSYFPPNRANGTIVGITAGETTTGSRNFLAGKSAGKYLAESDVIVIGDSALSAGTAAAPLNDANAQYSVLLGTKAGSALNNWTGTFAGPSIVIGGNSWASTQTGASIVALGCNIFPNATNAAGASGGNYIGASVLIGHSIGANTPAGSWVSQRDVIIGFQALKVLNDPTYSGSQQNVIIGYQAAGNTSASNAAGFSGNTLIGSQVGSVINGNGDTIIGAKGGGNYQGTISNLPGCIIIGAGTDLGPRNAFSITMVSQNGVANSGVSHVLLGTGIKVTGGNGMVVIGDQGNNTANFNGFSGSRMTLIGWNAGALADAGATDKVILETFDGTTRRACFYGDQSSGSICVGNSRTGTNRDMPGTNILKLITGTNTGTPLGGGFLYVVGVNNDLHWVDSSGADTNVSAGAAGALVYTYNAPLTGFAITIPDNVAQLVLEPAGTLAAGTVTLPANPEDGDTAGISTTQTITALTISPNAGQTVADAPTTLGVGGAVRFLYRATNTTWYRIGN